MRRAVAGIVLAVLLAGAAPERAAAWPLDVVGALGGTLGVEGVSGTGGAALDLGLLWRFEGPLSFGPTVFAGDLGTDVGRLRDPNDGTDLGAVALGHRDTWGAAWRLDAAAPAFAGGRLHPFVSATYGVYRLQADRFGTATGAVTAAGASLGTGVRYAVGGARFGVSVRYHRLFEDRLNDYAAVAMDWQWSLGETAPGTQGR